MGRRQKEQVIREESSYQSQAQINTSSQVGLGEALKGNHPSKKQVRDDRDSQDKN